MPKQAYYTILYDPWQLDDIVAAHIFAYHYGWRRCHLKEVTQLDLLDEKPTSSKPVVCVSDTVQGRLNAVQYLIPVVRKSYEATAWAELYGSVPEPPIVAGVARVAQGYRDAPSEWACETLWHKYHTMPSDELEPLWDDLLGLEWTSDGVFQELVQTGMDCEPLLQASRELLMPLGFVKEVGEEGDEAFAVNAYRPGRLIFCHAMAAELNLGLAFHVTQQRVLNTLYSLDGGATDAGCIARCCGGKGNKLVGEWYTVNPILRY